MAVVKIVPMPGVAVVGPTGAQGPIGLTGPAGTNGTNGTNGADGTELNFWNFAGDPGVPTVDGALVTDGLSARSGGNVTIHATTGGKVVVAGDGGEFLFDSNVPANQIATIGDIEEIHTLSNGLVVNGYIDDAGINPAGTMSLNVGPGYAAIMDLSAHSATFNGDVQVTNLSGTRITTIETPTTINNELSIQTEYGEGWTFDNNGYILGPWLSAAEDPGNTGRYLRVNGITRADNNPLLVSSSGPILINGTGGEFLNFHGDPNNQIATIGDLTTPTSGTWNPRFAELSNITYSDATSLHELGEYYCVGDLVFFDVLVKLNNVSDWGTYTGSLETSGSIIWSFELPFIERHQAMAGWQNGMPDPMFVGKIYDSTIAEDISQRTARDQGSYPVYGELSHTNPNTVSLYVTAYDNDTGSAVGELRALNKSYPSDLTQPEVQQSGFRMSGVYRKA